MPLSQWGNIFALGQGQARGVFSLDLDSGLKLTWENKSNGKKLEIPNENIWEIHWRDLPSGCKLTLKLDADLLSLKRLVLNTMRLVSFCTQTALSIGFVVLVVTFKPYDLTITFKSQNMGRNTIQEPAIVRGNQNTATVFQN